MYIRYIIVIILVSKFQFIPIYFKLYISATFVVRKVCSSFLLGNRGCTTHSVPYSMLYCLHTY